MVEQAQTTNKYIEGVVEELGVERWWFLGCSENNVKNTQERGARHEKHFPPHTTSAQIVLMGWSSKHKQQVKQSRVWWKS